MGGVDCPAAAYHDTNQIYSHNQCGYMHAAIILAAGMNQFCHNVMFVCRSMCTQVRRIVLMIIYTIIITMLIAVHVMHTVGMQN